MKTIFSVALAVVAMGCTTSRLPVVTRSPVTGQVTTNYVKQAELAPFVEPLGNAAGAPWGLPLGAAAAAIGGLIVGIYNQRQLKKHVSAEKP